MTPFTERHRKPAERLFIFLYDDSLWKQRISHRAAHRAHSVWLSCVLGRKIERIPVSRPILRKKRAKPVGRSRFPKWERNYEKCPGRKPTGRSHFKSREKLKKVKTKSKATGCNGGQKYPPFLLIEMQDAGTARAELKLEKFFCLTVGRSGAEIPQRAPSHRHSTFSVLR